MSKFLMCLALGFVALTCSVATADEVLDAHKKALGGTEAIGKIKSVRRSGDVEMTGQFVAKGTFVEAAVVGKKAYQWDPLESTCRHASLSIL